jgi:hypothetical protein
MEKTIMNRFSKRRAEDAIRGIRRSAYMQLFGTAQWATDIACRDRLHSIAAYIDASLDKISELSDSEQIRPLRQISLAEGDRPFPIEERGLRIGFYPLAANPLHWGHILVGLSSMASLRLDKIVFLIAGEDKRKPWMLSAHTRHRLGRSIIATFNPLFAYSSLALGTDLDGEMNFGRLLGINRDQRMEAFYIAGGDHYRRATERGEPDTIQKLEWIVEELEKAGDGLHSISAVFLDREGANTQKEEVATSLNVQVLPPLPLVFSSTAARQALGKEAFSEALGSLPYSYLQEIKAAGLYTGNGGSISNMENMA